MKESYSKVIVSSSSSLSLSFLQNPTKEYDSHWKTTQDFLTDDGASPIDSCTNTIKLFYKLCRYI